MRYAEDFVAGTVYQLGRWPMTEADIVAFAKTFDPQPMHIDPDVASAGQWGGLIASGLHTMAVYQALIVASVWTDVVGKAGRNVNARLRRPVRPGMVLTGTATLTEVTLRPEKGDAILGWHAELVDEASAEVVLIVDADAVVYMRPAA
ncbi:MaoC family dehydratase [Sporichthya brevicatena]|uniref:MaoC family dehydratase n=1 Tax=Sporichthya brevicatena TaxID=171442 RepID=A0ABN1GNZ4_9ACTN